MPRLRLAAQVLLVYIRSNLSEGKHLFLALGFDLFFCSTGVLWIVTSTSTLNCSMEMELNSRYRINYDRYQFTEAQLTQNLFVDKEAHASAVATAAVIEWQLTHRPEGQLINITSTERASKSEEWVGSVDRYLKIKGMEYQDASDDYNMAPPVGKWITRSRCTDVIGGL